MNRPRKSSTVTLSIDRLRFLLHYNRKTGVFTRRVAVAQMKKGDICGTVRLDGYLVFSVDTKLYLVHRLAWFYAYGKWPVGSVDHVDGDKTNNRILNLRQATHSENNQNQIGARRHSKTGVRGVSKHASGKWLAQLVVGGKHYSLGLHETLDSARIAYEEARRRLHPFAPKTRLS